MSIDFLDDDDELDNLNSTEFTPTFKESSPANKLSRRRRIEEIFEEKRLREEISDYEEI